VRWKKRRSSPQRLLLVDLENVQKIDLVHLPDDVHVIVFHGATQKSFPAELVKQTQQFGYRLKWMRISGQGSWAPNRYMPRLGRRG